MAEMSLRGDSGCPATAPAGAVSPNDAMSDTKLDCGGLVADGTAGEEQVWFERCRVMTRAVCARGLCWTSTIRSRHRPL